MDKALKITLGVIIVLLIALLLYNIFGSNKGLNDDIKSLKQSVGALDNALTKINATKSTIDSLEAKMDSLTQYSQDTRNKELQIDAGHLQSINEFNQNIVFFSTKINDLRTSMSELNKVSSSPIPVDTLK